MENTTYTEQATGAQRSVKSSSANDAAAGTGARTIRIWYHTLVSGVIGPLQHEDVTLNGTTAVDTVATDIALIETMEILTGGSGGVAAGTISIYTAAAGGGSAFGSIGAGQRDMQSLHHYVPSGARHEIREILMMNGDAATAMDKYFLLMLDYSVSAAIERVLLGVLGVQGVSGSRQVIPVEPIIVAGPARLRATLNPGSGAAVVSHYFTLVYSAL